MHGTDQCAQAGIAAKLQSHSTQQRPAKAQRDPAKAGSWREHQSGRSLCLCRRFLCIRDPKHRLHFCPCQSWYSSHLLSISLLSLNTPCCNRSSSHLQLKGPRHHLLNGQGKSTWVPLSHTAPPNRLTTEIDSRGSSHSQILTGNSLIGRGACLIVDYLTAAPSPFPVDFPVGVHTSPRVGERLAWLPRTVLLLLSSHLLLHPTFLGNVNFFLYTWDLNWTVSTSVEVFFKTLYPFGTLASWINAGRRLSVQSSCSGSIRAERQAQIRHEGTHSATLTSARHPIALSPPAAPSKGLAYLISVLHYRIGSRPDRRYPRDLSSIISTAPHCIALLSTRYFLCQQQLLRFAAKFGGGLPFLLTHSTRPTRYLLSCLASTASHIAKLETFHRASTTNELRFSRPVFLDCEKSSTAAKTIPGT